MTTRPPRGPRPARPATCSSSWNVRSPERKSGKRRGGAAPVAVALGALPRDGARPPAVVADETLLSAGDGVQGQGHRAGRAGGHVAAVAALHEGRRTPPVEEQDHLLPR